MGDFISAVFSMTFRIAGATTRALWSGSLSARVIAVVGIVSVLVFTSGIGLTALSSLMSFVLLIGAFVAIYSLVLRGH